MRPASVLVLTFSLLCTSVAFAATHKKHAAVSATHVSTAHATKAHLKHISAVVHTKSHASKSHTVSHAPMESERATQIQTALIKSGYLTGEPSGHWDSESMAAMQKLQSDNGWQTKIVPDSRALIKLGLGPASNTAAVTAAPDPAASN